MASIAVAGFYDDVEEVPADVAARWKALGFDEAAFLAGAGLKIPAGEKDRSVLEQTWSRPTCEINGMMRRLHRRRLQDRDPGQGVAPRSRSGWSRKMDPKKIREAFRAHVRARVPADCAVTFKEHGGSPAITVPSDGVYLQQALRRADRRVGHEGRDRRLGRLDPGGRRLQAPPRARSRCSSASPTTTTASTRPTRSTTSRASTAASAHGCGSSAAFADGAKG